MLPAPREIIVQEKFIFLETNLMKKKLLLLALLLPFVFLVLAILCFSLFGGKQISIFLISDIANLVAILIAARVLQINFNIKRWRLGINGFFLNLFLALFLFMLFYVEKVIFEDYIKGKYSFYQALSAILLTPVLEEFFSKRILMEHLQVVIKKPVWNILIIGFYFWLLHFPTLMITHLLFGLITATFYYYRRNLLQVILIHGIYNALIVIFNNF